MSAIENTPVSSMSTEARRTPRVTVAQLFLRAIRRWQHSRAINELSLLNDRQLDDIGISRNDIPRVVEGLFTADEANTDPAPKVDYRGEAAVVVAHSYPRAA